MSQLTVNALGLEEEDEDEEDRPPPALKAAFPKISTDDLATIMRAAPSFDLAYPLLLY